MGNRKTSYWLAAFFCGFGSVYAGPAFADDAVIIPGPEAEVESAQDADPINLYSDEDDTALPQGQTVNVGTFGEIDLHVKDLDLTKVLQLLSIQSQRNIIASRNVAGKVSADLYGVDFYEAMDAILATNGFGFEEKGNFIYVYTAEELEAKQLADREVVTKVIRLNYLTATDAGAFLQPMLSAAGSLSLSGEAEDGFEPSLSDGGADSTAFEATIVVRDYPEIVEEMEAVIAELDVRPKQVLIESMILTAALTENNEFGVDFAVFTDVNISDFVTPLNAVEQLITGDNVAGNLGAGQVVTSQVGNTAKAGGFKVGVFNDDFAFFARALDAVTDTTVLAKPQLLVLNRQKADLLVGERLGYLSSTSTDTSTTQTVEFLDVGTRLTVRPFISTDDFIRLEVRPSVSDGSTSVEAGQIIPNETTNEMISNVMVKSGQTVVLGGFFKESNAIDRRQIPGGGDIPVVGYLFKGQDDTMDRDEVIFMLRPTVMKDNALAIQAESASQGVEMAVLGSRNRLLPWSHQRLVASALASAHEHMEAGETDKALWDADVALYLSPTSVEAMRIKEELTGERYYYVEDSILGDSIKDMIDNHTEDLVDDSEPMVETQATGDGLTQANEATADEARAIESEAADTQWTEADAADTTTESDSLEAIETADAQDPAEDFEIVEAGAFDIEPATDEGEMFANESAFETVNDDATARAEESAEAIEPGEAVMDEEDFTWWEESTESSMDETFDPEVAAEADAEIDAFLEAEAFEEQSADTDQPVNIFDFVNAEMGMSGSDEDWSADAEETLEEDFGDTDADFEVVEVDPSSIEDVK